MRKLDFVARNILDLYPQHNNDYRRKNNSPVAFECRKQALKTSDNSISVDIQQLQDTFRAFNPKIQDLKQHINNADSLTKNRKMLFAALSPIVPIRRISSLEDNINDGNYARAAGLIGLMAINLPEDTRDLKSAAKQILKGELPEYDYKNCQAPFSFFRGTVLEPIVNKMGKLGIKLYSLDKTLYDTKFGKYIRKIFKVKIDDLNIESTGREVPLVTLDKLGKPIIKKFKVFALRFEGTPVFKTNWSDSSKDTCY